MGYWRQFLIEFSDFADLGQRPGQAAMNAAKVVDKGVVDVVATDIDPFYNDELLPYFMMYLANRWKVE